MPDWATVLSEELLREVREAPRFACDCCGCLTLFSPGHYEICRVCNWEDDRVDNRRIHGGPDAPSGPNRVSLTEARVNYARFGACTETAKARERVRPPRPEELPAAE